MLFLTFILLRNLSKTLTKEYLIHSFRLTQVKNIIDVAPFSVLSFISGNKQNTKPMSIKFVLKSNDCDTFNIKTLDWYVCRHIEILAMLDLLTATDF